MERLRLHQKPQGFAIVVLIIVLLIATGIGLFGLRSSQGTLKKIGVRRNVTELKYAAEIGLQKAVQRFQMIAENTPALDKDVIAQENFDATGPTGGDYNQKNIAWLLSIDQESIASSQNPACNNWESDKNFDQFGSSNVVCNFLGVVEEDIHVAIVRKDDLNAGGQTFAIFLINSIAYDSSQRRQITQGVVVVPYSGTDAATYASTETPYLSNSKNVVD